MKKIKEVTKKVVQKLKPSKFQLVWMIIFFLCFSGIFLSGSLSPRTYSEMVANDVALNIKENKDTNIVCLPREGEKISNKQSFASKINSKFSSNYPFKCIIGYNFDKTINCSLKELGDLGTKLSLITSSYFTNDANEGLDIITFHAYKIELLFKEPNTKRTSDQENFVYISKTQADYLIRSNANYSTYEDLIDVSLTFSENVHKLSKWKIANIFNDDGTFCSEAQKSLKNYVLCYSYLSDSIKTTEAVLFSFYDFTYSNIEYFNSIKNQFPSNSYTFHTQYKNNDKVALKLADYFNGISTLKKNDQTLSIIFLGISIAPFFVFAIMLLKKKVNEIYLLQFLFVSLFTWIIFFLIYKLGGTVIFFSSLSLVLFMIVMLVILFLELEYLLMDKYEKKN